MRTDEQIDELLTELRSGTINFDVEASKAIKKLLLEGRLDELNHMSIGGIEDSIGVYWNDDESEMQVVQRIAQLTKEVNSL